MSSPSAPRSGDNPLGDPLRSLVPGERVHLVGVGGAGMSGLAVLLSARGLRVDGCDSAVDSEYAELLENHDVEVMHGHSEMHIAGAALVVRTAAVDGEHPELVAAQQAGIPVLTRGELLPLLLRERHGVAVCGTHGKTTTTTFAALLLREVLGAKAGWCVGGRCRALGAGTRDGEVLVVEADESDGTLSGYAADVLVVTNVEFDHMEHFDSVAEFEACFESAVTQTRKLVVVCADDERAMRVTRGARQRLTYGFAASADLRIEQFESCSDSCRFDIVTQAGRLRRIGIPVTGRHNALNAVAALAAAWACGADRGRALTALTTLQLPARRFELLQDSSGGMIVSDYAHHPTEIRALLSMARERFPGRRLVGVFQPHRYTRTRALRLELSTCFDQLDALVLVPVYAASEAYLPGGGVEDLYAAMRERGGIVPILAESVDEARIGLGRMLAPDDVLLVIGAGDVVTLATGDTKVERVTPAAASAPYGSARAALSRRTTLGVGGPADWGARPTTEAALCQLVRRAHGDGLPVTVLGGGSNVTPSDFGIAGLVVWLDEPCFAQVRFEGTTALVGGGVSGAAFLTRCRQAELGGLGFLEGIPGRMGGLIAVNAGAYGGAIGEHLQWVRILSAEGDVATVEASSLTWEHHRCRDLESSIVLGAAVSLEPRAVSEIDARRRQLRDKRAWWLGRHTAGSVFRNPPGLHTGRLLDSAGCKGRRIGGAWVCERHANVIETESGATASDVRALMRWMERMVDRHAGVELAREVRVLW